MSALPRVHRGASPFRSPSTLGVVWLIGAETGLREHFDPDKTLVRHLVEPEQQRGDHRLREFAPLQCGGDPAQAGNSIGKLRASVVRSRENCRYLLLGAQPICAIALLDQRDGAEIKAFAAAITASAGAETHSELEHFLLRSSY